MVWILYLKDSTNTPELEGACGEADAMPSSVSHLGLFMIL